jgi:hypothetical protein
MNQEGHEMKQLWPNLRCYAVICLQRLRKTTKKSQDKWSQGQYFYQGPSKYEAEVLTTQA